VKKNNCKRIRQTRDEISLGGLRGGGLLYICTAYTPKGNSIDLAFSYQLSGGTMDLIPWNHLGIYSKEGDYSKKVNQKVGGGVSTPGNQRCITWMTKGAGRLRVPTLKGEGRGRAHRRVSFEFEYLGNRENCSLVHKTKTRNQKSRATFCQKTDWKLFIPTVCLVLRPTGLM
jgi:hypothetical protein